MLACVYIYKIYNFVDKTNCNLAIFNFKRVYIFVEEVIILKEARSIFSGRCILVKKNVLILERAISMKWI